MSDLKPGEYVRTRAAHPDDREVLLVVSHNPPIVYATRGDGKDGVGEVLLWRDQCEVVRADADKGWVVI